MFLDCKKPFLETKKHFQSKKWSKWPNFGRNFDISRKMGVLAQSAHFSPKWLHCLGLMSIMPSLRIIMPPLNAPNYSPRPFLYSNIYFYILWRGLRAARAGKVAWIWQKTASGVKVTTFTLKWGFWPKNLRATKMRQKIVFMLVWAQFRSLTPPGYRFDSLNLEGISLKPHQGFGILGRNFQVQIRPNTAFLG